MISLVLQYSNEKKLPGSLIDLCRITNHYKNLSNKVYTDFFFDLSDIIKTEQLSYACADLVPNVINSKDTFINLLSTDNSTLEVFYYSGHCENSSIIFPQGESLSLDKLESILSEKYKLKNFQMILDCCDVDCNRPNWICAKKKTYSSYKGSSFTCEFTTQ